MQFNSIKFLVFFPIVLIVYFIVPKKMRMYWLLIVSYFFYMSWNTKYAVLIFISTLITYLSGILFSKFNQKTNNEVIKKIIMITCICINLGILALFKYGNFCIDSINWLFSTIGLNVIERQFDFLLPVGISFYTFQALGYMIDVYRDNVKVEKNFFRYALFVSFFPQLVAGPIERSKNLLSQMQNIEKLKLWNIKRIISGTILMIWGLFMKMVIADRASILADSVFNNYRMFGRTELIIGVISFAIQIYCDFSSYSLIAIGSSKVLGFDLMENFNAPYFATSIRDFWCRWHISLSTWFKDYLYIPLGGNRKGTLRKAINTMIVFIISGLWHGANWSFVVWGAIHGLYQVIGDYSKRLRKRLISRFEIKTNCFSWRMLQMIITFSLVSFAWIFFRSDSITDSIDFIERIATISNPWVLFDGGIFMLGLDSLEMFILVVSVSMLFVIDYIRYKKGITLDRFLFTQNMWFEWLVLIVLLLMILTFGKYGPSFDAKQFIYFQF